MPDKNKVKFGLKNAHYALATIASDGTATFGTPVPVPGSVSLSISPEGELTPFYADNVVYWQGGGNSGYSGNWELADLPEQFKIDVLGYIKDENGVLVEDADAETKPFAFLFQMEGDVHARRHVLYNTVATRPEHTANTVAENKEPITDSLPITCKSIYNEALGKNIPKASVEQGEPAYADWFESVYQVGTAFRNVSVQNILPALITHNQIQGE